MKSSKKRYTHPVFRPVLFHTLYHNLRKYGLGVMSSSYLLRNTASSLATRLISVNKRMVSEYFAVRRLASPEEVREVICERVAAGGWRPGALDHVSFFAADESGHFVGELDGRPISCMSVVKHTENFAFIGNYIVDEPYRGSGYGFRTWKAAMASINDGYNYGGDAVIEKVSMYETVGMKSYWCEQRFDIVASAVAKAYKGLKLPEAVTIHPPSEKLFPEIFEYDTHVNVFPRHSFLKEWIFASNCYASVALDDDGIVVGYAVVRTTLREEEGWRIGPVFANNSHIARCLYRDLCQKVSTENPQAVVAVDVPYGKQFSQETVELVKTVAAKPSFKCVRIYKNGIPPGMLLNKVFALTAIEIG